MSEWKVFYSQDRMVDQAMGKGKNKPQAEYILWINDSHSWILE